MVQVWSIGKRRLGKNWKKRIWLFGVDGCKLWSGNLELKGERKNRKGT